MDALCWLDLRELVEDPDSLNPLMAREIFAFRQDADDMLVSLAASYGDPFPERWTPAYVQQIIDTLTMIQESREAFLKLAGSVSR